MPAPRRLGCIAVLLAVAGCGLAHQAGAGAASGAGQELESRLGEARGLGCPHSECMSRAFVKGLLAELQSPEQRDQLNAVVRSVLASAIESMLAEATSPEQLAQLGLITETAAQSMRRGFLEGGMGGSFTAIGDQTTQGAVDALRRALGAQGQGPLATSFAATAEQVSASTVRGIRAEAGLFPECSGPDRARCVDERLTALSRAASIGVREGLRGIIAIPLLVFAFVLGLIVALLIGLIWSHRRTGGEPRSSMRLRSAH